MKNVRARLGPMMGGLLVATLWGGLVVFAAEPTDTNLLPNGSLEFWVRPMARHSATNVVSAPVPLRWKVTTDGAASVAPCATPHGGRQAVSVRGARGRATFTMSHLEVYPGATYRYGVWARGKGDVRIEIAGIVMEGQQTVAQAQGSAGAEWTHIGGTLTVPRHVLDRLQVSVSAAAGTDIDDLHVSAPLILPFDADAVLRDKPQRDGHTLFFEDFDGASPAVLLAGDSKSAVTGPEGGRFGRGLRLVRPGLGAFSLALDAMPREGCLEYWITQDDFRKATHLALMSPGDKQSVLEIGGGAMMRVAANVAGGKLALVAHESITGEQARAGQWLHVAVEWDEASLRIYVNGVLADVAYGSVRWPKTPSVIHAGNTLQWLCWDGVLDEVRLSGIRRYRPPVPAGFTPFPSVMAAPAPAAAALAPTATGNRPPYDEKALRPLRGALPLDTLAPTRSGAFEALPDATGAYVYEATSLRPLIEGALVALSTNKRTGIVVASLRPIRSIERFVFKDNEGAYWKLGALPEGDYWIGLLRSGGDVALYLNGRVVQFDGVTAGWRVDSGLGLSELQAGRAVHLRPGDELAVMAATGWQAARLILRSAAPPPVPHYVAPHYDPHRGGPDTALAVNGQVIFRDAAGAVLPTLAERDGGRNQVTTGAAALQRAPDGRPAVLCELFNPLPTPLDVEYAVAVRSYHRLPVGGEQARLRLDAHARLARLIPFDALEDERAFSAELKLRVVGPQGESAWRAGMGWPALDWIGFYPGLRQGLPWPKTFEDDDLRRIEFSQPVRAVRRSILLNGDRMVWEQAYSADWRGGWPTREPLDWAPAVMPVHPGHSGRKAVACKPKAHSLYMRRFFVLPADADRQSCEIFLEETSHAAEIFVNGIEVGRIRGGNAPLVADATAAARTGTNELVLVAHNALAIMDPAYINPASPEPNLQYLDAPGLWDAWAMGLGKVELRLSPRVAARSLQVIPSTRQKTLRARFEVVNHRAESLRVKVRARVFDADKVTFDLGEREIEIPAGATMPLEFSKPWPDARWWWPRDPHLYVMAVETLDLATGERLDLLRARFGFRESWIDGPHMMLNDMAIRPKGSWLGYREEPNHFARGVDGSAGPDYCDERGMMGGTYITSLGNTGTRHAVERDAFWEAVETNALRTAMSVINHPSIMRWDMSNEWLIFLYGGDPMQGARRFKQASDIVRAFDPTRWTTFGADGDVMGLMDHFDFHYMTPYFQDGPGHPRMRGHSAYLPDGRFWRELQSDFQPGQGIPLSPHRKDVILRPDKKMVFERECLWKVGDLMPPGTTAFAGENAVLWPAWDAASGPSLWMWKQEVDGRRDLGVSLVNHFTHPGLKRRAMALQTFIVPEVEHHGFGGRMIERRYAVLQDMFRTCEMVFRWTLRGPDGKRVDGGEVRQRMTSGTTHRGVLRVKLPEVKARTVCVLALELESDGQVVMAEERDLAVWPEAPVKAGPLTRKVQLFETEGSPTAKALTAAGVVFERVGDFSETRNLTPETLLVIGEDALDGTNAATVAQLAGFVEQGGRVLILRQSVTPAGLPAPTPLAREHWASQAYVRAGNHPVMAGWTDWDFHFWADDRSVVRGGYVKPESGPTLTLLDSGETRRGLEWAGLMEQYRGEGRYLLCQVPVVTKYDEEPMARELLARLLRHAGGDGNGIAAPTNTLTVLAEMQSPILKRLEAVGARYERVEAVGGSVAWAVLADAALVRNLPAADRDALGHSLSAGATVVIAGATPADTNWLSVLAGGPVRISVPPQASWDGRGRRCAWTPFTAGLSQVDLYWKRFDEAGNAGSQAEDPQYVIEAFQDFAVTVTGTGVVESVSPGALVEIPRGPGRLILDQRNIYTTHPDLAVRAARNVCALIMGMGARIDPPTPRRAMPVRRTYRTVDLAPFANRALEDETAGDGKGGWTDEGAEADLRRFPAKSLRIEGVPFECSRPAPRAVALSRPDGPLGSVLPDSVSLPIGAQLEGLYFLHTAAGLPPAGPSALYTIVYRDGTRHVIGLEEGVNLRNWTNPGGLKGERGTYSTLAWTGSTPRYPLIGVYRMEWVNPWPDKPVDSVTFSLPPGRGGLPMLLALTAVVREDETAAKRKKGEPAVARGVTAGQAAQARQQGEAAAAALREGNEARARTLAEAALNLDPACEEAHTVRADLGERAGGEEELLKIYRDWIAAGARIPRPYNRVGGLLERRQDWRGALTAYARSLELEWNQPPIIEARSRVEQKVK
jgi:hypothetical protein